MSAQVVPSQVAVLESEVATLNQLLKVLEEQALDQFEIILAQQATLEHRACQLDQMNLDLVNTVETIGEIHRALPGALLSLDFDGVIQSANDAAVQLLGATPTTTLVGERMERFLDNSSEIQAGSGTAAEGTTSRWRKEAILVSMGGERIPALVSVATCSGAQRKKGLTVVVAIDLRERKRLELELRQAQKLESVGRLAAGIAHEINTPVQFISDSIHFLRDAAQEFAAVLQKLQAVRQSVLAGEPATEVAAAANEAEIAADLPYLLGNVPKAFERCLDGLNRVATIVRSIKEFAHPDAKEKTPIDLNRAIASTITIARNEYKYVADVETDFGDLPLLTCHPGELNQAILNIVVNAAHAIGDAIAGSEHRGRIAVRTRQEGEDVVISIADTGAGIPLAIREQIFDPFFTTKEVGKGTGQGLAIARTVVVEMHQGKLTFESEVGRGTTFFIRLPLSGSSEIRGAPQASGGPL
jgi:two-component system NtrC family sensor kinase